MKRLCSITQCEEAFGTQRNVCFFSRMCLYRFLVIISPIRNTLFLDTPAQNVPEHEYANNALDTRTKLSHTPKGDMHIAWRAGMSRVHVRVLCSGTCAHVDSGVALCAMVLRCCAHTIIPLAGFSDDPFCAAAVAAAAAHVHCQNVRQHMFPVPEPESGTIWGGYIFRRRGCFR